MSNHSSPSPVNGHLSSSDHPSQTASAPSDIFNASSVAEIKATLSHLHDQEASVTTRLDALVASQKDFSRELGRLDLLRAHLGSQTTTTRSISHGMLSGAAATADRISSAVRRLDLEQARVKATLQVVEQVAELKACVLGVAGSMGAPQDWETAASYISRASKIPPEVVNGSFAAEMVPTAEVPDPPNVTLHNAAESLCGLFLREFDKAVKEADGARITRFFKLFPLVGRSEVGLDVYGRYVCQGVASKARANLNAGAQSKDGFFYASTLTKLFEHIAQIVDGHGGLVERHYGPRKMNRVIERLQIEADVQGGIIIDTWSDERYVDRKLTDIKSYAFTFLVQSFLPAQRGTPRSHSPGTREAASRQSEDEGVDMKEIDGVLNEMGIMLSRWSLYCQFLADKCNVGSKLRPSKSPADPLQASEDIEGEGLEFVLPNILRESSLFRKINDRLVTPFNSMTTFFVRRSVEKAFQLDEPPSGLTLNIRKPLKTDPPHITSAVDDIMYIVNKVLQQSLATSQIGVVTNVVPTMSRVLGSDFIGLTQRKMRDEYYPRAAVQGAQPPEQMVIMFLVLINNLDVAVEYIRRIVQNIADSKQTRPGPDGQPEEINQLQSLFPAPQDAALAAQTMQALSSSFESKITDLLSDGIQVIFNNIVKNRLRPILADTFRDIEYQPRDDHDATTSPAYDHDDADDDPNKAELVRPRFAAGWTDLLHPLSRILTPAAFDRLLTVTLAYAARLLEKRLWSYHGRTNALGTTRLERDVFGIVNAAVDVGDGHRAPGRYRHREAFARCTQMVLVMGMDEDEWEDVLRGGEAVEVVEKLSAEERMRARAMVRRG
jgi:hypothetical protein